MVKLSETAKEALWDSDTELTTLDPQGNAGKNDGCAAVSDVGIARLLSWDIGNVLSVLEWLYLGANFSSARSCAGPCIVECVWNTLIVPTCTGPCRCAGRVLSGLGFHRISDPRSFAEFVHTLVLGNYVLVLGNYVCHSMPESGLDSLVAPQTPGVKSGGITDH